MLEEDYTTKIVNLEEVKVTKAENICGELHIHIELPRRKHRCPVCKESTDRIHDYREQKVKDLPLGRTTYLYVKKRRYVCQNCGKRFYEENSFLARYHRMTKRLIARIITEFRDLKPCSEIAKACNISSSTAFRYFDCVKYSCRSLPQVLSIDEFKGNAGNEKYQTIVTDAKNKKVLDILPNRYESDLREYFSGFSNKNNVKYFVIDMNTHFKSVGESCFPNAKIVADKYHVIRQVFWAMENVRKAEQSRLSVRFCKYFKRSKSLLSKHIENLTEDEMNKLSLMFEIAPRLARAYDLKNRFVDVMRSRDSVEGRKKLSDWMLLADYENMPEFKACTTAYRNWFTEILNSFDVPWTNGFTEGCNNKTKVLKRVCFGVRNFDRFKNRIIHCSA